MEPVSFGEVEDLDSPRDKLFWGAYKPFDFDDSIIKEDKDLVLLSVGDNLSQDSLSEDKLTSLSQISRII